MSAAIWHELEYGSYAADLPVWTELAEERPGPVLELGCGTGRVASHLARKGHRVRGIEIDPELVTGSPELEVGDVRDFDLGETFGLVLAPMQLYQTLEWRHERVACLGCAARHLSRDGAIALAIVEDLPEPVDGPPPLPDTREVDGWVYSSRPLEARLGSMMLWARQLRQTVSPEGELSEAVEESALKRMTADTVEGEAELAGLCKVGALKIPPSEDHVGSTVVILEREP